jgi:hypothetical protein
MKELPVNQIGKIQRVALKRAIQPNAKVVQTDFRSQACLKAGQGMGPLTCQPMVRCPLVSISYLTNALWTMNNLCFRMEVANQSWAWSLF